jgi:hypothetical protein
LVQHPSAKTGFPAGNPIANALVIVAGVLAIAASVVLGFFAFIALSAIVLVTAAVVGIRVWWLKRKMGSAPRGDRSAGQPHSPSSVIEGEYRVVRKDRDEA